jgi:hypothetical protein
MYGISLSENRDHTKITKETDHNQNKNEVTFPFTPTTMV